MLITFHSNKNKIIANDILYILKLVGEKMKYNIGDIVRTKKTHPCGSKLWEITRVGVDFKLKCQGCGHIVTLNREKALKVITKIEKKAEE